MILKLLFLRITYSDFHKFFCILNYFSIKALDNNIIKTVIEIIWDTTVQTMYRNRLGTRLEAEDITDEDDTEISWLKIKLHIKSAANKTLGYRKVNKNAEPQKNSWFNPEVKRLVRGKKGGIPKASKRWKPGKPVDI